MWQRKLFSGWNFQFFSCLTESICLERKLVHLTGKMSLRPPKRFFYLYDKHLKQIDYIIETMKSDCGSVESKGHCSIIRSVFSQMGRHILPVLSSVVDSYLFFGLNTVSVPPLCITAKYTPRVDVAGLGNEKLILHVRRRRAPPLSLCMQTWTEKKKKGGYCESVQ